MASGTERRDGKGEGGRTRGGESGLTIVAVGTRVVGDVESDGVVKVEGEVVGTVRADRQVLIARGGRVEGDVIAGELVVGGLIQGGVQVRDRVEVQPGAVVHGDIATGRLVIQEGGEVNGTVRMAEEPVESTSSVDAPRA